MRVLPLLKKNLRHGWSSGSISMIAACTILVALWRNLAFPWLFAVPLVPAAIIAASACFSSEIGRGGLFFLETLPVTRAEVFLASYLDGLLTVLAAGLAMGATALFVELRPPEGARTPLLELVAGGVGPALAVFGVVVLARIALSTAGELIAGTLGFAASGGFVVMVRATGTSPSPFDLAAVFAVIWLSSSALAFALFVRLPPHRAPLGPRLVAWLGALASAVAIGAGAVWLWAWWWIDLAHDPRAVVRNAWVAPDRSVVFRAGSNRTYLHALRVVPGTGAITKLGRGVTFLGETREELLFDRDSAPGDVFGESPGLHVLDLATGVTRTSMRGDLRSVTAAARAHIAATRGQAPDPGPVVEVERKPGSRAVVYVRDEAGGARRELGTLETGEPNGLAPHVPQSTDGQRAGVVVDDVAAGIDLARGVLWSARLPPGLRDHTRFAPDFAHAATPGRHVTLYGTSGTRTFEDLVECYGWIDATHLLALTLDEALVQLDIRDGSRRVLWAPVTR